jgi:hypothetical protein
MCQCILHSVTQAVVASLVAGSSNELFHVAGCKRQDLIRTDVEYDAYELCGRDARLGRSDAQWSL